MTYEELYNLYKLLEKYKEKEGPGKKLELAIVLVMDFIEVHPEMRKKNVNTSI
jgi:hypothetical protein